MLQTQTIEKLQNLKLTAMVKTLENQGSTTVFQELSFEEKLGLLADQELSHRQNVQLQSRLKSAKLRQQATFEDINFRKPRGLDKAFFLSLASCQWIREHLNIIITGPCGVGKSYIACALAHKACLEGFKVLYLRLPRLFEDLAIAHGDGSFSRWIRHIQKADLVILDDWGLQTLVEQNRRDLLEIAEDRYGQRSTIITSQLPIEHWHEVIGNPTLADAILDRLVHNAYKVHLKGDSMRKHNIMTKGGKSVEKQQHLG